MYFNFKGLFRYGIKVGLPDAWVHLRFRVKRGGGLLWWTDWQNSCCCPTYPTGCPATLSQKLCQVRKALLLLNARRWTVCLTSQGRTACVLILQNCNSTSRLMFSPDFVEIRKLVHKLLIDIRWEWRRYKPFVPLKEASVVLNVSKCIAGYIFSSYSSYCFKARLLLVYQCFPVCGSRPKFVSRSYSEWVAKRFYASCYWQTQQECNFC
jgi:hypothetical protein